LLFKNKEVFIKEHGKVFLNLKMYVWPDMLKKEKVLNIYKTDNLPP
jgi:hypothetical protein